MQERSRNIAALLIILFLLTLPIINAADGLEFVPTTEPRLTDNFDGNWTATWELRNTNNYTLNNIELSDGSAKLKLNRLTIKEDSISEFNNGTKLNIINNKASLGLDLRRNTYTLIADRDNNRVVEIDFDRWYWQYGSNTTSGSKLGQLNKPTYALRLDNNMTMITDQYNNRVIVVGRQQQFYWQYGSNQSAGLGENLLNKPTSAAITSMGNVLIADTDNNYVVEVSLAKKIFWQFGYSSNDPKDWSTETSKLNKPTYAEELPNGNILITDHGNQRVIVVDKAKNIRWQYGTTGSGGSTGGRLDGPTYATIIANGNTLITDMNNHRVIEVTPLGVIKWQYGKTKNPGSGIDELKYPTAAIRLRNGNTLIADTGNHRTIEVTSTNSLIWQYGINGTNGYLNGFLNAPRSVGSIKKEMLMGFFVSQVIDGGDDTKWERISWEQVIPTNTVIFCFTRTGSTPLDNQGSWSEWAGDYTNSSGEPICSPINRYIQYAAVLLTIDLNITPVLKSVTITGSRFEENGELRTEVFKPDGLLAWIKFWYNYKLNDQDEQSIQCYYSTGKYAPWIKINNNSDMRGISTETGEIKFRFVFSTTNITCSPVLDSFSLIYHCLGKLTEINITPENVEVTAGKSLNFSAIGYDAYGHQLEINPSWETNIGEIFNGNFTARTTVGAGYVKASVNEVTGTANINIIPGDLHHIQVSPAEVKVITGESLQFNAQGFDRFNNTINITPDWETDVGEMQGSVFKAQSFAGKGKVIAHVGEIYGKADITVIYDSLTHHAPEIISRIPDQIKPEDAEPWILNLAPFEFDQEDSKDELLWYITDVNTSLFKTTGSFSDNDLITFIPKTNAYGNDQITVWLVDSDNMTDSQQIWVNITSINDKPNIEKIPDLYVHYNEPYVFDYSDYVSDIELPTSKLDLNLLEPEGQKFCSIDGMNITYYYPESMLGKTISLILSVSDGEDRAEESFKLTVSDNHVPILLKPFPDVFINEGESVNYIFDLTEYFRDEDGDKLNYFYSSQFVNVLIHQNRTVSISSIGHWSGIDSVKFRAVDPYGAIAEGVAKVKVIEVNSPPKIRKIPDLYVHYDYEYTFNISNYVYDPDNSTSELILTTDDPEHVSFPGSKNNIMLLNYPLSMLGMVVEVILNVTDGFEKVWTTFKVHITDNFPPAFNGNLNDFYFEEDTSLINAFKLSDYFSDMDDDVLFYSFLLMDDNNISITLNSDNTVDIGSEKDWFGNTKVYFRAEDSDKAFVETEFNIIVIPVNDPPNIINIPSQNGFIGEKWVLDLKPFITDVDNNISELNIVVDSEFVTLTGFRLTIYPYRETDTKIELMVSDGYSNTTSYFNLKIKDKDSSKNFDILQIIWLIIIMIILIILITTYFIYRSQAGNFEITDFFLIHKNGVLIKYEGKTLAKGKDEDIIGSMLTAVQTFITDSFADGSLKARDDWGLNQLKLGKNEILLERGKDIFAAVIYKGRPGKKLPKLLKGTVQKIENRYGKVLNQWNGSYKDLKGIEKYMEPVISSPTNLKVIK